MRIQRRERICRHCKEPYSQRAGRGLCQTCWRNEAIRFLYPPLAVFGGKGASEFATVKAKDKIED